MTTIVSGISQRGEEEKAEGFYRIEGAIIL